MKEKKCENCIYFKPDFGVFTATGWTGNGEYGWCQVFPDKTPKKNKDDKCIMFEEK